MLFTKVDFGRLALVAKNENKVFIKIHTEDAIFFGGKSVDFKDNLNSRYQHTMSANGFSLERDGKKIFAGDVMLDAYFYKQKITGNKGCSSDIFDLGEFGEAKVIKKKKIIRIDSQKQVKYLPYDVVLNSTLIATIYWDCHLFLPLKWDNFIVVESELALHIDIALFCFVHSYNNDATYVGT